ncbi:hypothetical protein L226DRAFT_159851 [Lentinus tigrinus ALCF2SS1-7]|uniref:uncharacterized protein n=1 Tax=Lentinus tigrinus ALCF2SS1-7 TaxID=1328758 RepID=UPI00116636CF|nr:hypothetical protein L226DRAFT_159851 [Lentinus tigrinus ALCF2SS1-7]
MPFGSLPHRAHGTIASGTCSKPVISQALNHSLPFGDRVFDPVCCDIANHASAQGIAPPSAIHLRPMCLLFSFSIYHGVGRTAIGV